MVTLQKSGNTKRQARKASRTNLYRLTKKHLQDPSSLPRLTWDLDLSKRVVGQHSAKLAELQLRLQTTNNVVVLTGAGISVNAGVPDFQTLRKLGRSPSLFDISAYDTARSTEDLHSSIGHLFEASTQAKPSVFHTFLEQLADSRRLIRHYTQNLDCIEQRLPNLWAKTVQLHGRIDQVRCQFCSYIIPYPSVIFQGSILPDCERCEAASAKRKSLGKRVLSVGRLRPNIVLYGEDNPHSSAISQSFSHDIRREPDVILVAGTSLQVPGARIIVRELCRAAKARGGIAIWINKNPPASQFKTLFDVKLRGDCDDAVMMLLGK
ncbi:NAD-dependent deacetylase hst3 [Lecanora helva]